MLNVGSIAWLVLLLTKLISANSEHVGVPPVIEIQAEKHMFFRDGSRVELSCFAVGAPTPQYEWYKNGRLAHLSSDIIFLDGSLIVLSPSGLNEGYYQCKAYNEYGTAVSVVTHLQRAILRVSAQDTSVTPHYVKEPDSAVLKCPNITSLPPPVYSWTLSRDANDPLPAIFPSSRRQQIDDNGNYYFSHVTMGDERDGYLYRCNAYNKVLDLWIGGSYATIEVETLLHRQGQREPQLMYSTPSPHTVLKGERLSLKCIFSGVRTPEVSWERQVSPALPNERSWESDSDTRLSMMHVQFEDEAIYICTGRNAQGRLDHEINVIVQSAPEFVSGSVPGRLNISEGLDATFHCKAHAEPPADIEWLVNGAVLSGAYGKYIISEDGTELTIKNVCRSCPGRRSDVQVIQCNATNMHGYALASGYLNVLVASSEHHTEGSDPGVMLENRPDDNLRLTHMPADAKIDLVGRSVAAFDCGATTASSTPVAYTWYHEAAEIEAEDAFCTVLPNNTLTVNATGLSADDFNLRYNILGEYTCEAKSGNTSVVQASARLILHHDPVEQVDTWSYDERFVTHLLKAFEVMASGVKRRAQAEIAAVLRKLASEN